MRRISSRATVWYKRIFPIFDFGILLLFLAGALVFIVRTGEMPPLPFLLIPLALVVAGYVMHKLLVSDLVDEVLDDGDALIIKNSECQQRVLLSDIRKVDYSLLVNPPRVTLTIDRPGPFGQQVTFCAPLRFVPFTISPVIRDLIRRTAAARGA
jgi:hypothetical protein